MEPTFPNVLVSTDVTTFLFVLIPVIVVTTLLRGIFAFVMRLFRGSSGDGFVRLIVAHLLSLFIVGNLSLMGAGASDFPTIESVLAWSIAYVGPPQAFLFLVDAGLFFWRRRRISN